MKRDAALVPLSRQHHDGLALGVMIDRALRPGGQAASADEIESLRKQALDLWELEYAGHFKVEEEFVFPAAIKAVEPGLVDELLAEHQDIRDRFAELERASPAEAGPQLDHLREALVNHIRREERVLFQAMQEAMDSQQMEALGSAVADALPAVCLSLGSAADPASDLLEAVD